MKSSRRPRLTPAIADIRRAVRALLPSQGLVLVGLSGGADSLALCAATAFEAGRAGIRAGAIIVDHNLQAGSADVAATAAQTARRIGLDPVLVLSVRVESDGTGPESAARTARYSAFDAARQQTGASAVLLGHTLDDQAETVLLGLARGSGPTSLHGMAAQTGPILRPLLGIRRAQTRQFCVDAGLEPWSDPQNFDRHYARVRARETVLPLLESELGPGVGVALARTAEALREDSDALDDLARAVLRDAWQSTAAEGMISAAVLAQQSAAVRQRVIRLGTWQQHTVSLDRGQTLAVAALVTHWHGQGALSLPGIRVVRRDGTLIFSVPTRN
jgi:tRNA(Ile)-lysidine synthase